VGSGNKYFENLKRNKYFRFLPLCSLSQTRAIYFKKIWGVFAMKDKTLYSLNVIFVIVVGGFLASLVVPLFIGKPSIVLTYGINFTRISLFGLSVVLVGVIAPIILYSERRRESIRADTMHNLRNGLQNIVLTVDILKEEKAGVLGQEDVKMLDNISSSCYSMNCKILSAMDATPFSDWISRHKPSSAKLVHNDENLQVEKMRS
jgi:hypothetical protein